MEDPEESIKVVVRMRKLLAREKDEKKVFKCEEGSEIYHVTSKKSWSFDRVFSPMDGNRTVYYDTVSSIIESTVSGFNATIFAYGQTSSGKTYTMMGNSEEPGVTKQAVEQLFFAIEDSPDRQFLMQVSYMEIYNEVVMDLLAKRGDKASQASGLKIRENEHGNVYVENVTTIPVTAMEEVFTIMAQGENNRHYGETKMNDRSSRSHTIFRILLESTNRLDETIDAESEDEGKHVMISHLNLVDLAGSEKAGQTGAEGARLKEGSSINKSLMMLGQVIQKLSSGDKSLFINYRDSKLTRLLQNSLGGNAKTAIIATVTPAQMSEDQTLSTLRFASQAKTIITHAKVNEVMDDQAKINQLKNDLETETKEKERLMALIAEQRLTLSTGDQEKNQQLMEELETLRREKEEQILKNRLLQEKILVSSQPAKPGKKSLARMKENKNRRETWAAPRNNQPLSRASFGFLPRPRALPPLLAPQFNFSPTNSLENIPEVAIENIDDVFIAPRKPRRVQFSEAPPPASSDLLQSPERFGNSSILDISLDNGTPKAIIRDKYKRVSHQLSAKEVELARREEELLRVQQEFEELEQFTRLEDEVGVIEERRVSRVSTTSIEDLEKLKYAEKSFADAETLSRELTKELRETKVQLDTVTERYDELKVRHDTMTVSEAELREKLTQLQLDTSSQTSQLRTLHERCSLLENENTDFNVQLEMKLGRKDAENLDLKKALNNAYEELAVLEKQDMSEIKDRLERIQTLQNQVAQLEGRLSQQDLGELERLREGLCVITAELETMTHQKTELESTVRRLEANQTNTADLKQSNTDDIKEMENKMEELIRMLSDSEQKVANLELGNQSLMDNINGLVRQNEELTRRTAELTQLSEQLEISNSKLSEQLEISNSKLSEQLENSSSKDGQELLLLKEQLQKLSDEKEMALKQAEESGLVIKTLKGDKEELSSKVEELSSAKQELATKAEDLYSVKQGFASQVEELTAEKQELTSKVEELSSAKQAHSAQVEDFSSVKQQLSLQVEDLMAEKQKLASKVEELTSEQVHSSQVEELSSQVVDLTSEKQELSSQLQDLSSKVETLTTEKENLTSKLEEISFTKELGSESEHLLSLKETNVELSSKLKEITLAKEELALRLETALNREDLDSDEASRIELANLKDENKELHSKLEEITVSKEELSSRVSDLSSTQENILSLQETNAELQLAKEELTLQLEKLALHQVEDDKSNGVGRINLELQSKLDELTTTEKDLSSTVEELAVTNANLTRANQDLSAKLEELSSMVESFKNSGDEEELSSLNEVNEALTVRVEELEKEKEEIVSQLNKMSSKHDELSSTNLNNSVTMERDTLKTKEDNSLTEKRLEDMSQRLEKAEMARSNLITEQEEDKDQIKNLITDNNSLQQEISRLKSMQVECQAEMKSTALTAVNATLANLEESMMVDQSCMQDSEQTMNLTLGNQTFGTNEIAEMRNQLVCLQQQLIHFDFEGYETNRLENERLRDKVSQLSSQIANTEESARRQIEEEKAKLSLELAEKHKIQLQIISTKSREQMNLNFSALEDKLREEANEKRGEELTSLRLNHQSEIQSLKTIIQQSADISRVNTSHHNGSLMEASLHNESKMKKDTIDASLNPGGLVEMSFDETINFGANLQLDAPPNSDNLEVQMLRGELDSLKEELGHRMEEIEALKKVESNGKSTATSAITSEQENEWLKEEIEKRSPALSPDLESSQESALENQQSAEVLREQLEEQKQQLSLRDEQLSDLKQQLESGKQLFFDQQDQLSHAEEQLEQLKEQIHVAEPSRGTEESGILDEPSVLTTRISELETEKTEMKDRMEQLETVLGTKEKEMERLNFEQDHQKCLLEALQATNLGLENNRVDLSTELESLKTSESVLKQESNGLKLSLDNLQTSMSVLKQDKIDLKITLGNLQTEAENLTEEKTKVESENIQLASSVSLLNSKFKDLSDYIEKKAEENTSLSEIIDTLKIECQELSVGKSNLEDKLASTEAELEALKTELCNVKGSVEKIMEHSEQLMTQNNQLETNLLDLQPVEQSLNAAHEVIKGLTETNTGLNSGLEAIKEENRTMRDICTDLNAKCELLETRLVESRDHNDSQLQTRISELEKELDSETLALRDMRNERQCLKENLEICQVKFTSRLTEMENQLRQSQQEKIDIEENLVQHVQHITDLEVENHNRIEELKDQKDRILEMEHLRVDLENKNTELRAQKDKAVELEQLKAQLEIEVQELRLKGDNSVELEALRAQLENKNSEMRAQEGKVVELERLRVDLENKVQELSVQGDNSVELENLRAHLEKTLQELKVQEDKVSDLEDRIDLNNLKSSKESDFINGRVRQLESEYQWLEDAMTKVEAALDKEKEETSRLSTELKEARSQSTELETSKSQSSASSQIKMIQGLITKLEQKEQIIEKLKSEPTHIKNEEFETLTDKLARAEEDHQFLDNYCEEVEVKLKKEQEEKERLSSELETTRTMLNDISQRFGPSPNNTMTGGNNMLTSNNTMVGNNTMDFTAVAGGVLTTGFVEEKAQLLAQLQQEQQLVQQQQLHQHQQQLSQLQQLRQHQPEMLELQNEMEQLRSRVLELQSHSEELTCNNQQLNKQLQDATTTLNKDAAMGALKEELNKIKADLGKKNIEYASLKVDVDREELKLQKQNKHLVNDLEYERQNVTRLTNKLRCLQNDKMETTVLAPKSSNVEPTDTKATNTSTSGSPVWTSGSGTIKEIHMYQLEHKTRHMEKEIEKLKYNENFYIDRGSRWKSTAMRYEGILKENRIQFRQGGGLAAEGAVEGAAAGAGPLKEVHQRTTNAPKEDIGDLDLGLLKLQPTRDYRLKSRERGKENP